MNPNPKAEFLKLTAPARQWADVTASDAYSLAVSFSLAEYARSVNSSDAQRLAGARDFIEILSSIAIPNQQAERSIGQLRPVTIKEKTQ